MDPNPTRFPILSFVLSRLHSSANLSAPASDIEAPNPSSSSPFSQGLFETELVEQMPHLKHPDLLDSMVCAVSEVAQARSVLKALGERPDHEELDAARSQIADIDTALNRQLEEILHAGGNFAEMQEECRVKANAQKLPFKTLLKLDEMHEAYDKLLREAEEKLEKIYVSSSGRSVPVRQEDDEEGDQLNEDVVAILQEAPSKGTERVVLSGQRLRFLPEAFGRLHGLISLDVSHNQLQVI